MTAYIGNSIYKRIAGRLFRRHGIRVADHINVMEKVGTRLGQGITFEPKDSSKFVRLLRMPRFAPDDGKYICDRIASAATKGKGYREVGVPSLHVQAAPGQCNVHLDSFGFVAIGPNGKKYYNPDLIQHIVDELLWEDKFVNWVSSKNASVGALVGRFHPVLPSSRNRYRLAAGGRFDIKKGVGWRVGIEATRSLSGENQYMGKVDLWAF